MASYIALRREAFDRNMEAGASLSMSTMYAGVRRPLRGIEHKQDTHALMKVITSSGEELPLYDSSGYPAFLKDNPSYKRRPYSNFIISDLREAHAEKVQLVETFGEDFAFFFGSKPLTVEFSGVLPNTADFNWKKEWWANYDKYLKGTALVENDARLYFFYDDSILEGYLLGAETRDSAGSPNLVMFAGTLLVTNYIRVGMVGSDDYPDSQVSVDPRARQGSYGTDLKSEVGGGTTTKSIRRRGKISDNYDEYLGTTHYWDSELFGDDASQIVSEDKIEGKVAATLRIMGFSDIDIAKVTGTTGFSKTGSPYDDEAANPYYD